ncbi:MAG: rhodanese-like domain-containing protein [Erythrobacter sp.]
MSIGLRNLGLSAIVGVVLLGGAAALWLDAEDGLVGVHQGIAAKSPSVAHISAEQLSRSNPASHIVFDTRAGDEFAVSHISGAIRISPEMPTAEFLASYGTLASGKTAVFYCSVGARSSNFASRIQSALKAQGAADVVNLKYGLFGWHNQGRPLQNKAGAATESIHPYDDSWGRLLERKQLISYGS